MLSTETKEGRWYVADNRVVVDHEGYIVAAANGKREAKQIARDHNAVRDALEEREAR